LQHVWPSARSRHPPERPPGTPICRKSSFLALFSTHLDRLLLLDGTDLRYPAGHPALTSSGLALNRLIRSRICRGTKRWPVPSPLSRNGDEVPALGSLTGAHSKFNDRDHFGERHAGHLMLQDHAGGVRFRSIKIKQRRPSPQNRRYMQ